MSDATLSNAPMGEAERLVRAASDALTDSMVERLTTTASNALEIVDRLNDDATREAIHSALDKVTELHQVGEGVLSPVACAASAAHQGGFHEAVTVPGVQGDPADSRDPLHLADAEGAQKFPPDTSLALFSSKTVAAHLASEPH